MATTAVAGAMVQGQQQLGLESPTTAMMRGVGLPAEGGGVGGNQNDRNNTDEDQSFVNTVSRIVKRVALEEGHEQSPEQKQQNKRQRISEKGQVVSSATLKRLQGPLSQSEIHELSFLCTLGSTLSSYNNNSNAHGNGATVAAAAAQQQQDDDDNNNSNNYLLEEQEQLHGFAAVEGDELAEIVTILKRHVTIADSVQLIHDAISIMNHHSHGGQQSRKATQELDAWIQGEGAAKSMALRIGLEAAAIIIFIVTSPGVDRRAINEDAIEAAIFLLGGHLRKNLVPALNQTGHLLGMKSDDHKLFEASPSKRRRRSSLASMGGTNAATSKALKKVYKLVMANMTQHIVLTERLEKLIQRIPLDNTLVLSLTSAALHVLEVDVTACQPASSENTPPSQQLQFLSISLLTAAFRKYPGNRETIIEDLFPTMLRLPSTKKSLRAFPLRYTSVPTPSSFSLFNAKLVGNILSKNMLSDETQPQYIQMMTALVLSLVQSCVVRPVYEPIIEGGEEDQQHHYNVQYQLTASGLQMCGSTSESFCRQLLKRCGTKGRVGEFRPILNNLVEDLLVVFALPEYPGAGYLLVSLTNQLTTDIIPASAKLQGNNITSPTSPVPETCYLNTAFDLLGKICSVQARFRAEYGVKALKLTTVARADDDTVQCYCEKEIPNQFLIACDRCDTCFHGGCVGVNSGTVPNDWDCDACRLAKIVERDGLKHDGDGEKAYIDEMYALQHAYLSMISHRANGAPELKDATQFHLAKFIQGLDSKNKFLLNKARDTNENIRQPTRIIAELLEFWSRPGPGCEPLSEEGINRMILSYLMSSSPLLLSFHKLLGFFIRVMGDKSMQSLRKLSLKSIEKTVEGNPQLMELPNVTKAVSLRLTDDSISVREAAVSLVGSYVVKSPAIATCFQASLLGCLGDQGVSVRKRAVKIFQEILLSNPRYGGRSVVCDSLLRQSGDPREEDSVRDLIHELFVKLWLENGDAIVPGSRKVSQENHAGDDMSPNNGTVPGAGVVTPTPNRDKTTNLVPQKRVDVAAEQMMEVVRASGSNEHLEALMTKLLRGTTDADKGRKQTERKKWEGLAKKHCGQIVNSLFELLLSIEEQGPRRPRFGKDLAATLQTISVFCDLSPGEVLQHIQTLLPYLKGDNGASTITEESRIVGAACDIIYRLAISQGQKTADEVGILPVAKDLVQITYKFGNNVSESAVRALSAIANCQGKGEGEESLFGKKLMDLVKTFYTYLYKKDSIEDFSKTTEKVQSSTRRALAVLGFFCQYGGANLEEELQEGDGSLIDPNDLEWSNSGLACYRIFSKYLFKVDVATKCASIRAFGGLFTSHPRLLLGFEQGGLIEALMSPDAEVEVQLASLNVFQRILLGEEKRIDKGEAKKKMDSDCTITAAKRIAGDQDSDATLFGGVLTNHANRLFEMTQSRDRTIRFASLQVVGSLLRQGQVNPNEATPYLFALQGDIEDTSIRKLALQLLMTEGEKRPDILRQRVCAGVHRAYDFQRSIYPDKIEVSALVELRNSTPECVFTCVYNECLASSRKQRQGFFNSLLGLFELAGDVEDLKPTERVSPRSMKRGHTGAADIDLGLLSFVSQILGHLPLSSASDPLFIIHKIGNIVTLQGAQILEQFARMLRPVGLASSDEYDETNFDEDALERAARSKFPTRTHEVKEMTTGTFDTKAFEKLCRHGSALVLLLRLKNFLKQLYHISETRILAYDPSSKDRALEKNLVKADATKPFDSSISSGNRKRGGAVNLDSLIRQYAEFRRLMREAMSVTIPIEAKADDSEDDEDGGDAMEEN